MTANLVSGNCGGTFKTIRIVKRPHISPNTNTEIENLVSFDDVVGHLDISVASLILAVGHVDSTESEMLIRRDDRISVDYAAQRSKDNDTTVCRADTSSGRQPESPATSAQLYYTGQLPSLIGGGITPN